MSKDYNPELYWDTVAEHIDRRSDLKTIAGDDEPYYRYKRTLFLELLDKINFDNKSVLEVGSGPGGNLYHLSLKKCKEIAGADISSKMIGLSGKLLENKNISLHKINGTELPFEENRFDIVFTSAVLQHNTDGAQLMALVKSICRVSKDEVVIFERIENKIKGHQSNLGRPVGFYSSLFEANGFILINKKYLKLQASYYACGIIRKVFGKKGKKEGEPPGKLVYFFETIILPFTKLLDKIIPGKRDAGMLHFKKTGNPHTI